MNEEHRHRPVWLAFLGAALLVVAFTLVSYSWWNARAESCQRADVSLDILGDLLTEARDETKANPAVDRERRDRAVKFYNRYLVRIDDVRC